MMNRETAVKLANDVAPGKELEIIHRCDECGKEFDSWLMASMDGHGVIREAGTGNMPWTIAIGCEGYYQLGRAHEE